MPLTETVFRMHHDSPLAQVFREETTAVGSLWCNNGERDVIEVRASDSGAIRKMKKKLGSSTAILSNHLSVRDNLLLVLQQCSCYAEGAVAPLVARENCLLMPPIIFNQGWEHYKIVSMTSQTDKRLFRNLSSLGEIEVLSRTSILNTGIGGSMRISTLSLFSRLTDKQLRALITAYERGYYRTPRELTTQELADGANLTRPTYEEHLRKAENKIISAVSQHLRLLYYHKQVSKK